VFVVEIHAKAVVGGAESVKLKLKCFRSVSLLTKFQAALFHH
jgi:hypothetical protein